MTAEIVPLRAFADGGDIEGKLIGAALELSDERMEILEGSGLTRDDFRNPRAALAWVIIQRLAQRRMEVTADTVCSAGRRANMLSDGDLRWLTDLQASNLLTKHQAIQVAEDIRVMARARHIRASLQQAIDTIDRGRFHPARLSAELESISSSLATDFALDETAEGELVQLNETWAANIEKGKTNVDPTGFRLLDSIIGGAPENLWFIHGRPGIGKNVVLSTMVRAQLERDGNDSEPSMTGVFLLEDGTSGMLRRWQADDLGIMLRDVGSKRLDTAQLERKGHVDAHHRALLRRIVHYRYDNISRFELRRRAMRMIFKDKVRRIYVDNMKEIDHRDPRARQEHWQQIAETTRVMRNLARDTGVPICILIHDTEETQKEGYEGPPDPRKMSGGQAGGDKARLVLGVWKKKQSLRITVTKANEISEAGLKGPTVELQRNFEAGTANPEGGRIIDLSAEDGQDKREAKQRKREESAEESVLRSALVAEKKAKLLPAGEAKPAEEKKPDPQPALLDVPVSTKPESAP